MFYRAVSVNRYVQSAGAIRAQYFVSFTCWMIYLSRVIEAFNIVKPVASVALGNRKMVEFNPAGIA